MSKKPTLTEAIANSFRHKDERRKQRQMPKRSMADILSKPTGPRRRGPTSFGAGKIEDDVIRDVSTITGGEAAGHDLWVDRQFLQSVASSINVAGIKARFTHPSLSGDGLGTLLGVVRNARVTGDRVIGDLHLAQHAYDTPDGDLAGYVKRLASEDPEHFGVSIVFTHDDVAESEFVRRHQGRTGRFRSPDTRNVKNYRHARLDRLRAADVVDSPAANPDGLFYIGQDLAADAEQLLLYALGKRTDAPKSTALSLDADRVASFVQRALKRRGLIVKGGESEQLNGDEISTLKTDQHLRRERAKDRAAQLKAMDSRPTLQDAIRFR